uniref:Uncharacterized protein n=1 Tax=Anguilla anguilla TaxID=7936 RepID=A0A0E9VNH5_ANGAN
MKIKFSDGFANASWEISRPGCFHM